jgi:hypothetical protein
MHHGKNVAEVFVKHIPHQRYAVKRTVCGRVAIFELRVECYLVTSCRSLRSIEPPFRGFLVWKCASVVGDQSTDCTSSIYPDMTARAI